MKEGRIDEQSWYKMAEGRKDCALFKYRITHVSTRWHRLCAGSPRLRLFLALLSSNVGETLGHQCLQALSSGLPSLGPAVLGLQLRARERLHHWASGFNSESLPISFLPE